MVFFKEDPRYPSNHLTPLPQKFLTVGQGTTTTTTANNNTRDGTYHQLEEDSFWKIILFLSFSLPTPLLPLVRGEFPGM
jgi:hypothetical protein